MIFVTGDCHGEEGKFKYMDSAMETPLTENDKLIAKVSVYLPSVELIALTSI